MDINMELSTQPLRIGGAQVTTDPIKRGSTLKSNAKNGKRDQSIGDSGRKTTMGRYDNV